METDKGVKCAKGGKNFILKVENDIHPTKKNFFHRKVIDNPLCPICEREEETIVHSL